MTSTTKRGNNRWNNDRWARGSSPPKLPRGVQMACQFCWGRKLKCDGLKPSYANCHT
ncbi:hypothetical protein BJ165DRAFT_1467447 [Panaeolus papilionaceus]|nr:hypothetical protein BJ165DRAFT_1467447 [Panaeolus papilionaceus]